MRKKQEIWEKSQDSMKVDRFILEVLLDIRELLTKKKKDD